MSDRPRLNKSALMIAILAALTAASAAQAQVSYNAVDLSGSNWQYDYTLTNHLISGSIEELTVFFTLGQYANLRVAASPGGWSPLVAQPDPSLPADGFFDAQSTGAGLASGKSVSGFAVDFTWLGKGAPGAQVFNIVNPVDYSTEYAGTTVAARALAAPEIDPGSGAAALSLLGGSLAVLRGRRPDRRRDAGTGSGLPGGR